MLAFFFGGEDNRTDSHSKGAQSIREINETVPAVLAETDAEV
jgi:hypothetical protein